MIVRAGDLRSGKTLSCKCLQKEVQIENGTRGTHGMTGTPEYQAWIGMRVRCHSDKSINFHRYGGRGIKVCDRWNHSFENFFEDMGNLPFADATLDRIDNDGDYEPGNCKWSTYVEQNSNKTNNHVITHERVTKTVSQWADSVGLKRTTLLERIKSGWSFVDAISTKTLSFRQSGKRASKKRWG